LATCISIISSQSYSFLFDGMTFKLFGKRKRKNSSFLGCANLLAAIAVEDFAWFVHKSALSLQDDPKGGTLMQFSDWTSMHLGALDAGSFVLPCYYVIAIVIATSAYFISI
jgi:hypothetical protein